MEIRSCVYFVTGATGWVGSAVTKDLIAAGHQVLGLARSDNGAAALAAAGRRNPPRLPRRPRQPQNAAPPQSDAVIHTAFNHDFSKFAENCEEDRRAIETIGAVLEGSDRPLLVTSGVALLAPGRTATEADAPPVDRTFPRKSESAAAALAQRGVRATTIRLAPSVHGHGDHGFVPRVIQIAREKGVSAYIGDGLNRWPGVHVLYAAPVYRLALARGAAGGPFHAIAEQGVPFREIAEIIGRRLKIPVVSKSPDEAADHFGWFAMFAAMDAPTSSDRTMSLLNWTPHHPGLLADIDHLAYFAQ